MSGKKSRHGGYSRPKTKRNYPRTARLNSLLQQIVADYFRKTDDEDIGFITVTGVEVDSDLNVAQVFVSLLDESEEDESVLEDLSSHRVPVQAAIARQTKIRKTPRVVFLFDPAVREGQRIERILETIDDSETTDDSPDSSS